MATRADIVRVLAKRRFNAFYWPNRTRQQLKQSAQEFTNPQWDAILEAMGNRQDARVGQFIRERLQDYLLALAAIDIEARLGQDDTLTIPELEDLF